MDYNRVLITYSSSSTRSGFRVDKIRSVLPRVLDIHFYTVNAVQTSGGSFQQYFTASDDSTVWDDEFDEPLVKLAAGDALIELLDEGEKGKGLKLEAEALLADLIAKEPSDRKWVQSEQ